MIARMLLEHALKIRFLLEPPSGTSTSTGDDRSLYATQEHMCDVGPSFVERDGMTQNPETCLFNICYCLKGLEHFKCSKPKTTKFLTLLRFVCLALKDSTSTALAPEPLPIRHDV